MFHLPNIIRRRPVIVHFPFLRLGKGERLHEQLIRTRWWRRLCLWTFMVIFFYGTGEDPIERFVLTPLGLHDIRAKRRVTRSFIIAPLHPFGQLRRRQNVRKEDRRRKALERHAEVFGERPDAKLLRTMVPATVVERDEDLEELLSHNAYYDPLVHLAAFPSPLVDHRADTLLGWLAAQLEEWAQEKERLDHLMLVADLPNGQSKPLATSEEENQAAAEIDAVLRDAFHEGIERVALRAAQPTHWFHADRFAYWAHALLLPIRPRNVTVIVRVTERGPQRDLAAALGLDSPSVAQTSNPELPFAMEGVMAAPYLDSCANISGPSQDHLIKAFQPQTFGGRLRSPKSTIIFAFDDSFGRSIGTAELRRQVTAKQLSDVTWLQRMLSMRGVQAKVVALFQDPAWIERITSPDGPYRATIADTAYRFDATSWGHPLSEPFTHPMRRPATTSPLDLFSFRENSL